MTEAETRSAAPPDHEEAPAVEAGRAPVEAERPAAEAEPVGRPADEANPTPATEEPATHAALTAAREVPHLGDAPGPIDRDDPYPVAGRKAMWLHVKRLLDADAALRDPDRPHDLKRYRVATRRLRAALRAFEDAFARREVRDLRDDLADLATTAGAARDLEVRIGHLNEWAIERGGEGPAGVRPLADAWQAERTAAISQLEARLRTRRHRRLLEDLVAFVESSDGPGRRAAGQAPARPIGIRAGSLVWEAYERILAYDRGIRWADLATMHQLRIEAKRLRYLLEFLGDILGPERADLVARLVAVQDHLGLLNDAVVTSVAVREFLQDPSTQLRAPERGEIATYLAEREREITRLRRSALRPWRAVAGITFARRLARTVVAR